MQSLSVVIVCKNEAGIISTTLQSLEGITDDIIVYDTGSNDGTQQTVKKFPVQLHEGNWEGFGKTKIKALRLAKYDWILSLDADEVIDNILKQSLQQWQPGNEKTVFKVARKNFLGNKHLKHGEWGRDNPIRFFNRKTVNWNDNLVHETLALPPDIVVKKLKGHLLHYTMKDMQDYRNKMERYAMLSADNYFLRGKKPGWVKRRLSPGFTFFNYFILRLGFLDGQAGYASARMTAWYTYLKYARLKELWSDAVKKNNK
jgi:glycosyltransferase involved in cell wall biosynthesis